MLRKISIVLLLLFLNIHLFCQTNFKSKDLIQFSGVVISSDSLKPVPYCNIIDVATSRGTTSDYFGYFSFVARKGDTLKFSSVGYKKAQFVIPDSLTTTKYSLIQLMYEDTILLQTAVIYPWPSKEQFADAFVNTKIPNDDYKRALANLERAEMKDRMDAIPMNGAMNFKWQQQQIQSKLYYAGQYPPNNLMNPIAWAQFIKAWKNGDFKRKDR